MPAHIGRLSISAVICAALSTSLRVKPIGLQRMTAMVPQTPNLKAIFSEDGAVILDIERDSMSTLNPTGAYVWQGLQRGETIHTIIANLSRDTGEDSLLVEPDVREFVAELQQKHLIPR
jgi:hypothetical protein